MTDDAVKAAADLPGANTVAMRILSEDGEHYVNATWLDLFEMAKAERDAACRQRDRYRAALGRIIEACDRYMDEASAADAYNIARAALVGQEQR